MSDDPILRSIAPATGWWALFKIDDNMIVEPLAAWAGMEYPGGSQWVDGLSADGAGVDTDDERFYGYYRSDDVPKKGALDVNRYVSLERHAPEDWFEERDD